MSDYQSKFKVIKLRSGSER